MSAAAQPQIAPPRYVPFSWVRNLRVIPRLENYPRIVEFSQTIPGKAVLLALFGYGLYYASWLHFLSNPRWKVQLGFLIAATAIPKYRRMLVILGTLVWACGIWWRWAEHPQIIQAGISLALAALILWSATRIRNSWIARRPVLTLLTGFAFTVFVASYLPRTGSLRTAAFNFLPVFGAYIWFLAYSLMDISSKHRDPVAMQVGIYQPVWGSSSTPFPKGAAYLRRIEAQNPEQLAIAQIKGLKLLWWSIVLDLFLNFAYRPFVHGYLNVPFYEFVFHLSLIHAPFKWYMGWASLISEFFENLISFSIWGHRIIAVCRMAGFNALRNTYRPLASRSIAEFWNRYYYYFKELLVDCFFYPAFMRYCKKWGRWRLFAATVAAAGFGNAFFHFFRDLNYVEDQGFFHALAGFQAYIFYVIVLSVGIGISQMRQRRREKENQKIGWIRSRILAPFCVSLFFCLLHVFDFSYFVNKRLPIQESFRFLGHLFHLVS
jgi:hypothetical protein